MDNFEKNPKWGICNAVKIIVSGIWEHPQVMGVALYPQLKIMYSKKNSTVLVGVAVGVMGENLLLKITYSENDLAALLRLFWGEMGA